MLLLTGISELLTMPEAVGSDVPDEHALGLVRDAALVIDGGLIRWLGPRQSAPAADQTIDLGGRVVLPGLIDAHTHLVYAGDRTRDYAARCAGVSYAEIARRGGGIRLTVAATRAAGVETLVELARPRLSSLLSHGCTTVEIKSGYGLSVAGELDQLEAVRALARQGPWRLEATCLAAHIVPDELRGDRAGYVRLVVDEILPEVVRRDLASAVDVFCDTGAFSLAEARTILEAGRALGLGLHVHGEQLTHTGVAALAARLGARSVDHLEHVDDEGIAALAAAGTTATLLPAASVFLGDPVRPPARKLIDAGVRVALATDSNPGSSPTTNPWLVVTLGCSWYGLAPHEALRAVTVEAARALGIRDGRGRIAVGSPADLAVCAVPGWRHLAYGFGDSPVIETWVGGERAYQRAAGS